MRPLGRDQSLELRHELVQAFGRQIEPEQFDGDEPIAIGIERSKHGPQSAGANLMENPEWTESVWRRATRRVRVQ